MENKMMVDYIKVPAKYAEVLLNLLKSLKWEDANPHIMMLLQCEKVMKEAEVVMEIKDEPAAQ